MQLFPFKKLRRNDCGPEDPHSVVTHFSPSDAHWHIRDHEGFSHWLTQAQVESMYSDVRSIHLPDGLSDRVREAADRQGLSFDDMAIDLIETGFDIL